MHTAELVFTYRSPEAAALVADAVAGEMGELDDDRASATLGRTAAEVRIEIEAADLVALRAGLNTWTSLVEVGERAAEAGRPGDVL